MSLSTTLQSSTRSCVHTVADDRSCIAHDISLSVCLSVCLCVCVSGLSCCLVCWGREDLIDLGPQRQPVLVEKLLECGFLHTGRTSARAAVMA